MKKITILLLLVGMTGIAQIKGNKNIITKEFDVENIENIKIDLYAKVSINQTIDESLSITADENLFQYLKKQVVNGTLYLDQIDWVKPSQEIIIKIGAPNLRRVEQGTHDETNIIVNNTYLNVLAPIGNVSITGRTEELRLGAELATIDASKIEAKEVFVNLWSYGSITVNPLDKLWAEVTNDGKLVYINKPENFDVKTRENGQVELFVKKEQLQNPEAQYIKFKIKNNSNNRHDFYVVGPKQDDSKFSYGFPMMPFSKRNENWTVGTKIYKVNRLGLKILLVEIKAKDENKVVNLFKG
jgi:hypothetical protein